MQFKIGSRARPSNQKDIESLKQARINLIDAVILELNDLDKLAKLRATGFEIANINLYLGQMYTGVDNTKTKLTKK